MTTFMLVYRSGPIPLTPEQLQENREAWMNWNQSLKETYGIRTSRGKVVGQDGVSEYTGNLRGASMIEAESLEDAVAIAKRSPTIRYGGTVEVLEEFQRV